MGVKIVSATSEEVVRFIDRRIADKEKIAIAFANANLLNIVRNRTDLKLALDNFLVLNDGLAVDLAARFVHGHVFEENLNGTDFVPFLLQETAHRLNVFLLGGKPGVADASMLELAKRYPRHCFVGATHGYFDDHNRELVLSAIRQSKADLLLVGLGNPTQEIWIAEHFHATGCKVALAVGAFLDFSSGRVPRAPLFMRRARAEWLFRLTLEPMRLFKRYTWDTVSFLKAAMSEGLRLRRPPATPINRQII